VGASDGIGRALAAELSARGATLLLSARRVEELEKLNYELGGRHHLYPLDVSDAQKTIATAQSIRQFHPRLDRVIFMAAIYNPMPLGDEDINLTRQIIEVNLTGGFNLVHAVLPQFKAQRSGQIVLCGSVAGYTGLPSGQPYSATKAGILNLAESLYAELYGVVDVKVISPGFVRTRMTDKNSFPMPMRLEPPEAARAIAKRLKGRSFEIHFPRRFTYFVKLLELMPYCLKLPVTRRLNPKKETL
jgi:short-subunit dehydrogenase